MKDHQFEYIETKRLLLRKVTPEVLQFVFRTMNDDGLIRFLGLSSHEELRKEKVKMEIGIRTHNKSFLYFHLITPETNELVGWCGFHTWYLDHFRAEIGYGLMGEKYKKLGFMSEAMEAIVKIGFSEMKLNRIEAFISPNNIPSLKLAQKFGFKSEGCLKNHYLSNEVFEDSEVFGLLRSDYEIS